MSDIKLDDFLKFVRSTGPSILNTATIYPLSPLAATTGTAGTAGSFGIYGGGAAGGSTLAATTGTTGTFGVYGGGAAGVSTGGTYTLSGANQVYRVIRRVKAGIPYTVFEGPITEYKPEPQGKTPDRTRTKLGKLNLPVVVLEPS